MNTLVILAAGLGSRFGGNKQLAEFGERKLTLMEYNIINAVRAGFNDVVFVIRPQLEDVFKDKILPRLPKKISYKLIFQNLKTLPQGCKVTTDRTKPLGTAHAVWCCHKVIKSSFAVINADDYYGAQAFDLLLRESTHNPNHHLMVAYHIQNTLSDFGGVNRGLCQLTESNTLISIKECEDISKSADKITGKMASQESRISINENSLISMNCWFFTPDIFDELAKEMHLILNSSNSHTKECYLPDVVMKQIQLKNKQVTVLSTIEHWFGLTYPEDTALVDKKITAIFS